MLLRAPQAMLGNLDNACCDAKPKAVLSAEKRHNQNVWGKMAEKVGFKMSESQDW